MKKRLKSIKDYYTILCFGFLFFTSISAMPTLWPNNDKLSNDVKQTCTQFKLLNGSNRIAEFKKIIKFLFQQSNNDLKAIALSKYTAKDIEKILGKPNEVLQNNSWVYNLNLSQQNCIVTFCYNNKMQLQYIN